MNNDLQTAIDRIRDNAKNCQTYIDYYDGQHNLAFASDKFANTFGYMLKSMRENLCPIVVDAPADRMEIINFASGDERTPIDDKAWEVWQQAQMEFYSHDLHKEAFKCGDAYLIVEGENKAKFYVQDSRQCAVIYDENTGEVAFGAKMWALTDKNVRLTLYYSDRVEKYITSRPRQDGTGDIKADHFIPYSSDTENDTVANTWGIVPMFHFSIGSILPNAIPVQDRLNKTICDELVAQEFAAFPQRWATGLGDLPVNPATGEQQSPFKHGAGNLWFVADENGSAKFGEFGEANLERFLKVEDAARLSIARVTGTPLHFFSFTTSDAISGEALKTLESRFVKRVTRTSLAFGPIWGEAMKLALAIEGAATGDAKITPQWAPAEQRSEKEMLECALLKQDLGVPDRTLWEEIGYTEEDIAEFEKDAMEEAVRNAKLMPNENPTQKAIGSQVPNEA
jgi:hypothetical protein